jgi:putative methionine-R-sulfoxide reductase with GAF domain
MTSYSGTLEAIDRILNRGGDADDVLRDVLNAMHERGIVWAAIRFVEEGELVDGPSAGDPTEAIVVPVVYEGKQVGELEAAVDDRDFLERVATLVSAHVLVGWDTGGESWRP